MMRKIPHTPAIAALLFAFSLAAANHAFAVGLGNAMGQAVLGSPLRVEIPLIGSDAGIPSIECFDVRPPQAEIASVYVLRNPTLEVVGVAGRASLLITTELPVQEPVIEFAVTVGCGFKLSKDYVLLAEEPGKRASVPITPVSPLARPTDAAKATSSQSGSASTNQSVPAFNDEVLRITSALTLEALARQTYPLQPKAREKFTRMMLLANPGLRNAASAIDSGTELKLPPGLPLRRHGTFPPAPKRVIAEASDPVTTSPGVTVNNPTVVAAVPQRDLLLLGAAAERNRSPAELLAEAERLATLLAEQNKTQDALVDQIGKLESTLTDVKKHYTELTDRLNRVESERAAEKRAAKPASLDFFELLAAVLAGGAIGALGMYGINRLRSRRAIGSSGSSRPAISLPALKSKAAPPNESPAGPSTSAAGTAVQANVAKQPTPAATVARLPEPPAPAEDQAQDDFDFSSTGSFTLPAQNTESATPSLGKTS